MTEKQTASKASTVPDRFAGIVRDFTPEQVEQLRPSIQNDFVIARHGAERLWADMHTSQHVAALGAMNGSQATNYVKAGMRAIYLSGWQVAADANLAGDTYPDQSLYPSNSAPALVKKLNSALARASQIQKQKGGDIDYFVPIVADGEAGFGGAPHAYELMKSMIEAGAAGVHFEDQLASEKKCGHMGGKVLVPTSQFIRTLQAARLAADVLNVPTVLIARTDSLDATLLTSDIDPRDKPFITGERTDEGFFRVRGGLESSIARGLSYAPYVDALWFETSKPDLEQARQFAEAIHAKFPGKLLSYNCSPSFNWKAHLSDEQIASFMTDLGDLGYKFQFVTLAGWHATNMSAFELAKGFTASGMAAYSVLQQQEFAAAPDGYTAVKHQQEVGAGFFDALVTTVSGGKSSTTALAGSTEEEQFKH
ncbi:isocitrate lyase [soil metagenome]